MPKKNNPKMKSKLTEDKKMKKRQRRNRKNKKSKTMILQYHRAKVRLAVKRSKNLIVQMMTFQ